MTDANLQKATLPFESLDRELVIKREYESSGKFGMNPKDRPISEMLNYSIINIDKPAGITSHQVSALVKDVLEKEKAGHSGTLDPGVTGVLPIGVNKATRIMQWLLTAGKEYVCLMHIHTDFAKNKIIHAMHEYTGKLMQLPPVKSAVKRQLRERNVYYVDIIDVDERDVLFKIGTQAGTYIRKWVHDFGLKLDTNAHMVELRRTKAGPFTEKNLTTLTDLKDAYYYYKAKGDESYLRKILITPEHAVSHLKKIYVMDTTVDSLCHGAFLKIPGVVKFEKSILKDDIVAVFTLKEELILVGRAFMDSEQILKSEKGIVVKTEQVFMDAGIYPKIAKTTA
ncbi:MAG: RNA-guided pseudouridylation complex pseudouridine synthase subunit Cbf5 [Candidatus Woesearchaeota archaeon]